MEEAEAEFKIIAKVYRAAEGGKPAFKTWQDVRDINPRITLNTVKWWFEKNIEPKNRFGGKEIATSPQDHTMFSKRIYSLSQQTSSKTRITSMGYP